MSVRRKGIGILALAIAGVFACVTINIYFPAEKVESVAGEIVKDIRGEEPAEPERAPGTSPESLLRNRSFASIRLGGWAWAQDVTVVSNAAIRALKDKMKARYPQLLPYYRNGAIKEGDDGFVAVTGSGDLGLKDKRDLNSLVQAENADRRRLYQEVAKAMDIDPSQVDRIAGIFAQEWKKSVR